MVEEFAHDHLINSAEYQSEQGRWDVVELPADLQVNAIHAALLSTGKLLIVAGSDNDRASFDAGTFRALVYDPANGQSRLVPTPADLFCSGHALLPDGKLLVAGGTLRFEVLEAAVMRAAGGMVVKNENPVAGRRFTKSTEFVAPTGAATGRPTRSRSRPPDTAVRRPRPRLTGNAPITATELVCAVGPP